MHKDSLLDSSSHKDAQLGIDHYSSLQSKTDNKPTETILFQQNDTQLGVDFAASVSSLSEGSRKALEVVFEESRVSVDVSSPKKCGRVSTKSPSREGVNLSIPLEKPWMELQNECNNSSVDHQTSYNAQKLK